MILGDVYLTFNILLSLGLKTEEKCDSWPVEKCQLSKQKVKKFTPETKCEKVPREVCAPEGCCIKEV